MFYLAMKLRKKKYVTMFFFLKCLYERVNRKSAKAFFLLVE